jgi:hypothetical protein
MKIILSHDPAFAYDLLSIAHVKFFKNKNNTKAEENFLFLNKEIALQVTENLHNKIINSVEYHNLYSINEEIYNKIDKIKKDGELLGDALYIDNQNYNRWLKKQELQNKWFNIKLSEQKFGYKNEN